MRCINLLLVFVFFTLCSFSFGGKIMAENEYVPARYVVLSEEITAYTAAILSDRHNMDLIGTGGGLANCVNILSLSFQIVGPIDKAQLREILIDSVETFLSSINSNEELRPHLSHYPFSPNGIEIEIFVVDSSGRPVREPCIAIASAEGGSLSYIIMNKEGNLKFKPVVREGYKEAKREVANIHEKNNEK